MDSVVATYHSFAQDTRQYFAEMVRARREQLPADALPLTRVLAATRVTRNQFNHWVGLFRPAKVLRTKFSETRRGAARKLTFENAMELAFTGALVRCGLSATAAVDLANRWMPLYINVDAFPLPYVRVDPVTGECSDLLSDTVDVSRESETEIVIINRGLIVRRLVSELG